MGTAALMVDAAQSRRPRAGEANAAPDRRLHASTRSEAPRRVLLVIDRAPAFDNGHGLRLLNVISGLNAIGELHVCLIDRSRYGERLPADAGYTSTVIPAGDLSRWTRV